MFHMMNIDVPAGIGAPPLDTPQPLEHRARVVVYFCSQAFPAFSFLLLAISKQGNLVNTDVQWCQTSYVNLISTITMHIDNVF